MGFVIALVAIAINVAFAMYAGGIAEQKGYKKENWIAVCIIFGIFGYTLIAALPDLELRATLENIEKKLAKDKVAIEIAVAVTVAIAIEIAIAVTVTAQSNRFRK